MLDSKNEPVAFRAITVYLDRGLGWGDVDFGAGLVRVRKQLGRDGVRVDPKTEESQRDVLLLPALARVLREAKLASSYSGPDDFVFASETGTPMQARNVARRGLAKAVDDAGLKPAGKRRIGWHQLRHGFGSMLLAQGENVVFVSGQLGHKDPRITLGIYAHEFNQDEQLEQARAPLDAQHGTSLETALGDAPPVAATGNGADAAPLRLIGDYGRLTAIPAWALQAGGRWFERGTAHSQTGRKRAGSVSRPTTLPAPGQVHATYAYAPTPAGRHRLRCAGEPRSTHARLVAAKAGVTRGTVGKGTGFPHARRDDEHPSKHALCLRSRELSDRARLEAVPLKRRLLTDASRRLLSYRSETTRVVTGSARPPAPPRLPVSA